MRKDLVMFDAPATKKELARIEGQMDRLEKRYIMLTARLIKHCKHPAHKVVEGRHTEMHRPFRVCQDCGYAEEGWGAGYWKLPRSHVIVAEVPRSVALKFVSEFVSQESMGGLGRYGEDVRKRAKGT